MTKAEYHAYLRSPQWWIIRSRVFQRDRGWCRLCKDAPAEHVHHISYKFVGDEPDDDLVSLCYECHEFVHESGWREFEQRMRFSAANDNWAPSDD